MKEPESFRRERERQARSIAGYLRMRATALCLGAELAPLTFEDGHPQWTIALYVARAVLGRRAIGHDVIGLELEPEPSHASYRVCVLARDEIVEGREPVEVIYALWAEGEQKARAMAIGVG